MPRVKVSADAPDTQETPEVSEVSETDTQIADLLKQAQSLHPPANSFGSEVIAATKRRDAIFARLDAMVIDFEEKIGNTSDPSEAASLRQQVDTLRRDLNHAKYTK